MNYYTVDGRLHHRITQVIVQCSYGMTASMQETLVCKYYFSILDICFSIPLLILVLEGFTVIQLLAKDAGLGKLVILYCEDKKNLCELYFSHSIDISRKKETCNCSEPSKIYIYILGTHYLAQIYTRKKFNKISCYVDISSLTVPGEKFSCSSS